MPLSEHEERILAEIERQLAREDPRFVERTRRVVDVHARRLRWAVVGFVLGLGLLFLLTFHVAYALVGIVLMFGSALVGAQALRARLTAAPPGPDRPD